MTVLIDKLGIEAFGAIRTSCELDLSASLTVLYAPNGTGKTSIIEAVDWLFESANIREARCRLSSPNIDTAVSITVHDGERRRVFQRRLSSDGEDDRILDTASVKVTDFLRALAPDCDIEGLSHHKTQIARLSAFLSSNRVLSVNALAALIDTADTEKRLDAMADFFGTRVQRNAQKQINLYKARLEERQRVLEREIKSAEMRHTDLERQASRLAGMNVELVLRSAASHLGLNETPRQADELEASLSAMVAQLRPLTSRKRVELEELETIALNYPDLQTRAATDESALATTSAKLKQLQQVRSQLQARSLENKAEIETASALLSDASAVRSTLEELLRLSDEVPDENTFGAVQSAIALLQQRFGSQDRALRALDEYAAAELTIEQIKSRITEVHDELDRERATLDGLGDENEDSARIQELNTDLLEQEAVSRARGVLAANLSSIAQEIAKDTHSSSCPACLHDWKTNEQLMRRLEEVALSLPAAGVAAASQAASLRHEISEVEARQQSRRNALSRIQQAQAELKRLLVERQRADDLRSLFSTVNTELRSPAPQAWRVRILRGKLYSRLKDLASRQPTMPRIQPGDRIKDANQSAVTWVEALEASRRKANDVAAELRKLLSQAEDDLAKTEAERVALEQRLARSRQVSARADGLKDRLGLKELSAISLQKVRAEVEQEEFRLSVAQGSLSELTRLNQDSAAATQLRSLDARLVEMRRCHQSLRDEVGRAARNFASIDASVATHRQSIIDSLAPAVSELFQRMQVNRVFEQIDFGNDLQLTGLMEGEDVDPQLFSAGQRQDLALAFFLVRAYALGGTFVLDEPLVHLDDLNRVSLIDTLRAFVMSSAARETTTRLVLTTASWSTARHICEKFMRLEAPDAVSPYLRVYQLGGNVATEVTREQIYPATPGV